MFRFTLIRGQSWMFTEGSCGFLYSWELWCTPGPSPPKVITCVGGWAGTRCASTTRPCVKPVAPSKAPRADILFPPSAYWMGRGLSTNRQAWIVAEALVPPPSITLRDVGGHLWRLELPRVFKVIPKFQRVQCDKVLYTSPVPWEEPCIHRGSQSAASKEESVVTWYLVRDANWAAWKYFWRCKTPGPPWGLLR